MEESKAMLEYTAYHALAMHVLAAAKFNYSVGDWAAYIDAVPGMNHEAEYEAVLKFGNKISKAMAETLFAGELASINANRAHDDQEPMRYRY